MGLLVEFDLRTFGYPEELSQTVPIIEEEIIVRVDYSKACNAFVETFLEMALDLVPVDTGYLQSTIAARTNGYSCYAEATAEYAQYVEYGTYKMPAQPYFEPAFEAAMEIFHQLALEAKQNAEIEMHEELSRVREESLGTAKAGGFGDELDNFIVILFLILVFPLILNIYGVAQTLSDKAGSEFLKWIPEIIIT